MNKKERFNKNEMLSYLQERIDRIGTVESARVKQFHNQELKTSVNELQIFQLEFEMQNQELTESHRLLDIERSKFAGFFNFAPVGYFILDHLATIEQANQSGSDLLQTSQDTILNKRFQSFIDPEEWELFYSFLHKMQATFTRQTCEVTLLIRGHQKIYTRMEGIAINNGFSNKLQYYLTVIDISESRAAQQQILDTSHRLEMTLSASGTGTWTIDLSHNKFFLDEFSQSLLDVNQWEFDGTIKGFVGLIHPDDRAEVRQKLLNSLYNHKEVDLEFRIVSKTKVVRNMAIKGKEVQTSMTAKYSAGIIIDITEQRALAEQSQKLRDEKQRIILSTAFSAQEKERHKISTALHDSVCQILYGLRMNLQIIQSQHGLQQEFNNVNDLLDQAIAETRALSYELTPSVLRDFGFAAGVREMALRFSTPTFKIHTNIKKNADQLTQDLQLNLFRIIQELVSNCIKYADATEARIMICTEGDHITLIVSDNGSGFNIDKEQALLKGSGLRGIKHRVYLLNGELNLETGKQGTVVTITFKNNQTVQVSDD